MRKHKILVLSFKEILELLQDKLPFDAEIVSLSYCFDVCKLYITLDSELYNPVDDDAVTEKVRLNDPSLMGDFND